MLNKDLIKRLQELPPDLEVVLWNMRWEEYMPIEKVLQEVYYPTDDKDREIETPCVILE